MLKEFKFLLLMVIACVAVYAVPGDVTPPVVTVPADMTEEATSASGAVVLFVATALDDFDGVLVPVCAPVSGSIFPLGVTSVSCSASDAEGNNGSAIFDIIVVDTTPPSLTPPDITVEAMFPGGAIVDYLPSLFVTVIDLVDSSPSLFCVPPGGPFPIGITPVMCTAGDDSGNMVMDIFDIIVEDTTPPVLSGMPSDGTVEATSGAGAVYVFSDPTATDIADLSPSVGCIPASGSTFPLGITTVTCTATDDSSNTDEDTFNVTVVDTTPPVISLSGFDPVFVEIGSGYVDDGATALDDVDGDITGSILTVNPVDPATLGTYTVTYDVNDTAGNPASTVTRTVYVVDSTSPSLVSAFIRDSDGDGQIDSIELVFDEPINDSYLSIGAADGWDVYDYDGESIGTGDVADDNILVLSFTESGVPDTSATPGLYYTASGGPASTHDYAGNELFEDEFSSEDGAAPLLLLVGANPVNVVTGGL